jgi:ATP-dependent DNA ligase
MDLRAQVGRLFRDGDEVVLQSRDEKTLNRYFPEREEPLRQQLPRRRSLDGEIVIARAQGLDFDALQMRIHPAASRVKTLAGEIPASIVFWDILCVDDVDLRGEPFRDRRSRLDAMLAKAQPPLHVTPATTDSATAADWFQRFEGAGLDGVMAKQAAGAHEPNKRTMLKVKHERDCDCVVAGFRWHTNGEGTAIGSLLLGLYDNKGKLQHVGVSASFAAAKRQELVTFLAPYRENALEGHPWRDWASPTRGARSSGCPVRRAGGPAGRTCRGSRFGRSSSSKSRTNICRGTASAIQRSSGAGAATRSRTTAPTPSSKSSPRTSSRESLL